MIRSVIPVILLIILSLTLRVRALSVVPGSPCYDACNGDQTTSSGDIVCVDDDFAYTRKGRLLSTCLSCLRTSTYKQSFIADNVLFLYYLSTVQQTCLSGKPAEPISDCSGTCKDLSSSFSNIVGGRGFFQSPYAYCNTSNNVYEDDAPDCAKCLRSQDGTVVLGNFVYAGNNACVNQPDLLNGEAIPGADTLFNTTRIGGTSASGRNATTTSSTNSTGSLTTPTNSAGGSNGSQTPKASATHAGSNAKDNQSDESIGGLSRGAASGIGIALGIIGIAIIVFIALLARRRLLKKQSTEDRSEGERGSGSWKKIQDIPEMRQTTEAMRRATPPAPGVYVPPTLPTPSAPKSSKSFKSLRSLKSLRLTPRTSEWYNAANPKKSSDVTALPQRGWD